MVVGGTAQADGSNVPVLTDLPGLLDTADAVGEDREVSDVALRRLYKATGSFGRCPSKSMRVRSRPPVDGEVSEAEW